MPAHRAGAAPVYALKEIVVTPDNPTRGLDAHQGGVLLHDGATGELIALLNASPVTAIRTAAVSAVATRALARDDATVLAVLGAGVQGRSHLDAVQRVRPFDEVRVASRTPEHARALADEVGARAVESFEEAVRGADVVCCCTHASEPVIRRDWLSPGTHVCSVGASQEGPELDEATVTAGLLCVESRMAFQPPPAGAFELQGRDPEAAVELGEVLAGTRPGRTAPDQITVYKSMGHAVEDAAAAALVLERARRL
jgi:ornithine cyclodeaminase/alanine dehydrogenase-like protein (mu-crystallin family)